MNKPTTITVKDLLYACLDELEHGNGDKKILVPQYDEGDNYHELLYLFTGDEIYDEAQLPLGFSWDKYQNEYITLG